MLCVIANTHTSLSFSSLLFSLVQAEEVRRRLLRWVLPDALISSMISFLTRVIELPGLEHLVVPVAYTIAALAKGTTINFVSLQALCPIVVDLVCAKGDLPHVHSAMAALCQIVDGPCGPNLELVDADIATSDLTFLSLDQVQRLIQTAFRALDPDHAYFDIGAKRLAAVLLVRVAHRIGPLSSDRRQCLNGLLAQTKDAALSSCLALIVWRCCAMSTSGNCHAFATTMGMSVIETLTFKGARCYGVLEYI